MTHLLKIAAWVFEFGLFGLLLITLIYARRLDQSIIRMRADRTILQALVDQIGASITSAIAASDRLKEQAGQSAVMLDDACQTAAVSTRRLDELISQATLITRYQQPISPPESVPVDSPVAPIGKSEEATTTSPTKAQGTEDRRVSSSPKSTNLRRTGKPQSRTERDLARMLLDVS